jgi:hypothetical protein
MDCLSRYDAGLGHLSLYMGWNTPYTPINKIFFAYQKKKNHIFCAHNIILCQYELNSFSIS